jgi:hypothetical protein
MPMTERGTTIDGRHWFNLSMFALQDERPVLLANKKIIYQADIADTNFDLCRKVSKQ